MWELRRRPGYTQKQKGPNADSAISTMGDRPCAVFRYTGPVVDRDDAERVLTYWDPSTRAADERLAELL